AATHRSQIGTEAIAPPVEPMALGALSFDKNLRPARRHAIRLIAAQILDELIQRVFGVLGYDRPLRLQRRRELLCKPLLPCGKLRRRCEAATREPQLAGAESNPP